MHVVAQHPLVVGAVVQPEIFVFQRSPFFSGRFRGSRYDVRRTQEGSCASLGPVCFANGRIVSVRERWTGALRLLRVERRSGGTNRGLAFDTHHERLDLAGKIITNVRC